MTDLYQHFRKEEQPFIDQVLSWQEEVSRTYKTKLSDFLNPRELRIYKSIVGNNSDYKLEFYGGKKVTERKRAVLAPFYEDISEEYFEIVLLEASYPEKFVTLSHRDVMGAFLSSGIKRKKLGDIVVQDGKIHILTTLDIAPYIQVNLTTVKKAKVNFEQRPVSEMMVSNESWITRDVTVSSLRLDVVLKELHQLSRQKASDFIEKGLVKVNFQTIDNPSFLVEEGDLLSVRGKGRGHLHTIHGQSKKEKWKVTIAKLNS